MIEQGEKRGDGGLGHLLGEERSRARAAGLQAGKKRPNLGLNIELERGESCCGERGRASACFPYRGKMSHALEAARPREQKPLRSLPGEQQGFVCPPRKILGRKTVALGQLQGYC